MSGPLNVKHILESLPIENLRSSLLQWWCYAKRNFPWRETRDPYKVLVAEILLHRTRANQVAPLYESFLQRFPDVESLAQSTPEELEILFHSGGLQWRWKLLHSMAVVLKERFQGEIPDDFKILVSLPGISHYIASSVRCFSFGHPDAILDTNTVRVAGRLVGLPVTDSSRRSLLFRKVLENLIDKQHPREFNFALIDFAALVCKSRSPLHEECSLKQHCRYYINRSCS
jgi:A/G-specific adenine glycosylase